jgi:flavin reductase (DIM6/NTAB) family NADH-FMN oxidoreductase RutF
MSQAAAAGGADRADISPALFRKVMGKFATGVTVLTAVRDERVYAMTANAFMSGSLEPPLCVVSIGKRARLHGALSASRHFGVSKLRHEQKSLSMHFGGEPDPALQVSFEYIGGTPVLPSALARIAVVVVASHDCGDHTLFVGRIRFMDCGQGNPLLFFDGKYWTLETAGGEPARSCSDDQVLRRASLHG